MDRIRMRRWLEVELALTTLAFGILLVPGRDGGALGMLAVIAGALIVIDLAVLVFVRWDKPQVVVAARRAKPALRSDFPGDVHQVVDLEGIGPAYAERLHAAGIVHTQDLLWAETAELAAATKAPAKTVDLWKAMSELVKVNGIGPQYAEALARTGIMGIDALRRRSAARMAKDVNDHLDGLKVNVLGQKVSQRRIEGWQKAAKVMRRGPIDPASINVRALESKAAIAGARAGAA